MKKSSLIFGAIVLTASLTACQQDNQSEPANLEPVVQPEEVKEPIDTVKQPGTVDSSNQGIVAGGTEASLSLLEKEKDKGEGIVSFQYSLKNQTPNVVTYHFNSGLQYDFAITNEKGEKIYQHSEEVMSTMALSTKNLRQGESLTHEIETPKLEKGKYKIEVWTNVGSKHDFPKVSEFEVK